ncbi:MAG: MoxR family ATPase [Gammaproteobacteria bacterium]|nr:MoxR family ATPase [Gammaproteobacteria bacterium]
MSEFKQQLHEQGYIADEELVVALQLTEVLDRPLLVEGDAGVGKTEIAKVLAALHQLPLIRLQCYEGLDARQAIYEWHYAKQLLSLNQAQSGAPSVDVFSEAFLLPRPLLHAIRQPDGCVLLIDEVDRADEAFEAFLLEVLSDFQVSIPELGTLSAAVKPRVILTANGTRELSDALRRRCLYHYIAYPDVTKEIQILRAKLPGVDRAFALQVCQFVAGLRSLDLVKRPGIAETLDWARAMLSLEVKDLLQSPDQTFNARSTLLKTEEDRSLVDRERWAAILTAVGHAATD